MPADDLILYAKWIPNNRVSYNGNGNTSGIAPMDNTLYLPTDLVDIVGVGSNFQREGHDFLDWSEFANGNPPIYGDGETGAFNMPASNIILYAKWDKKDSSGSGGNSGDNGSNSGSTVTELTNNKPENNIKYYENTNIPIEISKKEFAVFDLEQMANKNEKFSSEIPSGTFFFDAKSINFDYIAKEFPNIDFKEITCEIIIKTIPLPKNTKLGNAKVIGYPIETTIFVSHGNKKIEISEFSMFSTRLIPIEENKKITTAVIVEENGNMRHVPTYITSIDGKQYARVSSLTNSIYLLIYNENDFDDIENHWGEKIYTHMD